jgi:hypothetical protein
VDADPARDEPVALRRRSVAGDSQRERVARTVGRHPRADGQPVVDLDRSTPTIDDPANGDPVCVGVVGVSAQRVLAHPAAWQVKVEVCTGMPARQPMAVDGRERQRHHILVARHHLPVHHVQRDAPIQHRGR